MSCERLQRVRMNEEKKEEERLACRAAFRGAIEGAGSPFF